MSMEKKILEKIKWWHGALVGGVLAVIVIASLALPLVATKASSDAMIFVYPDMDNEAFVDSMATHVDAGFAGRVGRALKLLNTDLKTRVGSYEVKAGESPLAVARKIRAHQRAVVKFTFNNIRTKEEFAQRAASKFMFDKDEMLSALNDSTLCDSVGMTPETIVAVFLPDTYEMYWNMTAKDLLLRFVHYYDKFWTADRKAKATNLGLTPVEVATVASIAEEETAKRDERGKVARLYINRYNRGMPLQADPTVKFAMQDFAIKRITQEMTKKDSPYNTYRYSGFPPGPIRLAEKATIDAVLESAPNDYIYMCAKEDFSGYHNFTSNYREHVNNAIRYRKALDGLGL